MGQMIVQTPALSDYTHGITTYNPRDMDYHARWMGAGAYMMYIVSCVFNSGRLPYRLQK